MNLAGFLHGYTKSAFDMGEVPETMEGMSVDYGVGPPAPPPVFQPNALMTIEHEDEDLNLSKLNEGANAGPEL
jgi:hypothetical protein